MKPSKKLPRVRRRRRCLAPEVLEERLVLSSGQGSTIAIMPGSIDNPGQVSSTSITIDPSLFTASTSGKILLGIDVAAATSTSSSSTPSNIPATTLRPAVVSVADIRPPHFGQHTRYDRKVAKANHLGNAPTSAVLATLKVPATGQAAAPYTVNVKGLQGGTGKYLVGFYLPGDTNGDGTVDKTDITAIKALMGDNASNKNYVFDADVNRDGIINGKDLRLAQQELGATTRSAQWFP